MSETEQLLAVAPAEFVSARSELARRLRDEGRADEAKAVAALRKPPQVVLAVNRAARDRPQAAKDAAKAAERLAKAQLSGKPAEYAPLVNELETASRLLSDVALAHLSTDGTPTDAMRRRVADHLRGALASKDTRELLVRGALTDELAPSGFDAFAGLPLPKTPARAARARASDPAKQRRAREKQLRAEIAAAQQALAEAEERVAEATRERDELARRLEELEGELRA